jgi:hypothetical protein
LSQLKGDLNYGTVTRTKQSDGVVNFCHGSFTSDGAAQLVNLGFIPNYVYVINETDVITLGEDSASWWLPTASRWFTAGVMTLDAGSQIRAQR